MYILQSKVNKYLYVGCTNDLKNRMEMHNSGKVESTKNRMSVVLTYYEAYHNKDDAYEREKYLKTGWGKRYIKKILFNYLHS